MTDIAIYPSVNRIVHKVDDKVSYEFLTVVRKRYNQNKYYLILKSKRGENEVKVIYDLHSEVYRFLFENGNPPKEALLDENQEFEQNRLMSLNK